MIIIVNIARHLLNLKKYSTTKMELKIQKNRAVDKQQEKYSKNKKKFQAKCINLSSKSAHRYFSIIASRNDCLFVKGNQQTRKENFIIQL